MKAWQRGAMSTCPATGSRGHARTLHNSSRTFKITPDYCAPRREQIFPDPGLAWSRKNSPASQKTFELNDQVADTQKILNKILKFGVTVTESRHWLFCLRAWR